MKALRFILIAFSTLLLLVALIAPRLIGPKVEEVLQQQLANQPNIELTGYQRGWFGAEALTRLKGKDGASETYTDIQHGPVLFTRSGPRVGVIYGETRLTGKELEPALRRQLEAFYGPIGTELEDSPVIVETLVGTNDRVTNTLHLLPIDRNEADQQIQFDGARIQLVTDYQGQQQGSQFELGEFVRMDGHRESLYLQSAKGDFQLAPSGAGTLHAKLPLVRANNDSGPLELRDVEVDYTGELVAARTLNVKTSIKLPEIQSSTPARTLTQQINLPAISYDDLHHYLYTALLTPAAERSWPQVFHRPLKMQQQLDIESANGPMQLQMDVDWKGMPGSRQVKNDKLFWLDNLNGTANITAAEQALMQSPLIMQASALKQYGFLKENNGLLSMHLQLDRGNLEVNGQQLPADLFVLALMGGF
ncbi:DUF945 family protein [Microbulbifer hydrolyticus]|uniref:DUF945 family protein n=1 Tax=Microbulbifer hydrolyticus TaxID=48074 RepID=A0A6P1T8B6_9GAMM|nr:DUF945 family protein [Microbulbifer hydrolyticus]MBB5211316.1 hypothetical protein [Microbulbifer hydrolyticus]QHQ37923.1 DUF945 family protein [Microbulbifer hydrolyticus]